MILPTDAYAAKQATGYSSPMEAFMQNYFARNTEVKKLREQGQLMDEATAKYNNMYPDESDYQGWAEGRQAQPPDMSKLSPEQMRYKSILDNIQAVIGAKKSYATDPQGASTEANKRRSLLKALGIDPEKYGLGASADVSQGEGLYNSANDSFIKSVADQQMRQQFASLHPGARSGVPFAVNPIQQQRYNLYSQSQSPFQAYIQNTGMR